MTARDPRLPSAGYLRLLERPDRELEHVLLRGERPDPDALVAREFLGTNTPWTARVLGIRKFIKGFDRRPDGRVLGFNTPVVQGPLEERWTAKPSDDAPKRFGFFEVSPVDPTAEDNRYLNAVLLDYGAGGNPWWDPSSRIRDYLVRVEPGSDHLLLGKAFMALGPARVRVSYFVLQRVEA